MNLEALKAAKKRSGLTIAEIAERANLPKGTVQNIFCGYVPNPRSDTLDAIKRALGINREPEWTEEERSEGILDSAQITITAEEMEWLELRNEILRVKGQDYLDTLKKMLTGIIEKNK